MATATLLPAGLAGLAAASAAEPAQISDNVALAELAALLAAHDKAFNAHDLEGVLKTYAPGSTPVVVGTGPGELWVGQAEIADAYKHFFADFDSGKQTSEYLWQHGHIGADTAWMATVGKITMTKGAETTELGLNTSVVAEKIAGKWAFVAFHFSNPTSCPPPGAGK